MGKPGSLDPIHPKNKNNMNANSLRLLQRAVIQKRAALSSKTTTKTPKRRQNEKKGHAPDGFTNLCRAILKIEVQREYRFHPTRMWRFDYAIPEHKIAIEVEGGVWTGGRHTNPQGFMGDIDKYNQAALLGWRVFRTTPDNLVKTATFDLLKEATNPIKEF